MNKPVLVHSRDAMQDTFDIMKAHHWKGLLHCFSGTKEMAKEFTKLGYYIALGGALTFKNARHSVEVCSAIDENYLLSETDCPYMAPVPYRGKRNEPSYIPLIVKKMAEVRNTSEEHMAEVISANWDRFLGSCR
jgi:TatD DNase family protein